MTTVVVRGLNLQVSTQLVTEECCVCGVIFAMPADLKRQLRDAPGPRGRQFWCPNGHQQHYTGKTEAEKQRERAERLEQQLASREEDARAARIAADRARRQLTATKGQLTRARRRADAGVCQHCNRSFVNVARHVATKHPEHASAVT